MTIQIHQSTAKIASDCLARFKAEVVDGVPTGSPYASLGSAVHAAIEAGLRGSYAGNREPLDCALEGLDVWWAQREPATSPPWVYAEAERLLRASYGPESWLHLGRAPRGQQVAAEQGWHLDEEFRAVQPEQPHAYAGRFDLIEWGPRGVTVRDYKTTFEMRSARDIETDEQARVYALAALALFGAVDEVRFELLMIRHGYSARHTFKRGEPWERQTQRWLRAVRSAVALAEETGEWPETIGDGCRWCPVRYKCGALRAAVEHGTVSAESEPEAVARLYLAAKGVTSQAEAVARAWAEESPIPVGIGKVLGFKPGKRKEWTSGVARVLEQFRADGATQTDLEEWFPGHSLTVDAVRRGAEELAVRGELDDPSGYEEMFREDRPCVTFTTYQEETRA